jgi:hypothetical protein
MAGSIKSRNHEKQNMNSFVGLSFLLMYKVTSIAIIPMPIIVSNFEKAGIGAMSNGRKNFATDSGIVLKFIRNGTSSNTSLRFEIPPIALYRSQNQNNPETA